EREFIACGGGGALLLPSHHLSALITVPPVHTLVRKASRRQTYRLTGRYPDAKSSRRYAWGIFPRLPFRNPGFTLLLGALHTLLRLAMAGVAGPETGETQRRRFSIPLAITPLRTV